MAGVGSGGGGGTDALWAVMRLAAAAAAAGGLCWLLRRQQQEQQALLSGPEAEKELEELLLILEEMAKALFVDCTDVAATTKTVHDKIESGQQQAMVPQLKELWQARIVERLSKTQVDAATRLGRSPEELTASQQRYLADARVRQHVDGCQAMLQDTLEGRLPVLPGAADLVPPALTEDKAVEILIEAYTVEEKKVKKGWHRAKGKQQQVSFQDFEAMTAVARRDALQQVLEKRLPELGGRTEVFLSTIALFSRTPAFAQRKAKVDAASQPNWGKFLSKATGGRAPPKAAGEAVAAAARAGQLARMGMAPDQPQPPPQ